MLIFTALLNNAALLVALVVVLELAISGNPRQYWAGNLIAGTLVGCIGLGIMTAPTTLLPGVMFDTRTVLLCLSGLFFGAIPTAIAILITASYRLVLGGGGAWIGVLGLAAAGGLGIGWRRRYKTSLATLSWRNLYLLGMLASLIVLGLQLLLPWETARQVLSRVFLPVLILYPIAIASLGVLLASRLDRQNHINALHASEELKQAILDSESAQIAVLDDTGIIVSINEPWRRFCAETGCTPGDPAGLPGLGVNYLAYWQPSLGESRERVEQIYQGIQNVLTGQLPYFTLEYAYLIHGQQYWFTLTATPLRTAGYGVVIAHTDITAQKWAEQKIAESESRFREIYNAVNDAIFIFDATTSQIVDVNRRMCEMYRCTREEALAATPEAFSEGIPPYSATDIDEKFRLTRTEGPQTFDWRARTRDGYLFWVEVSLRQAVIGTQTQILALIRDISERKEHEKQLMHIAHYDVLTTLPNRVRLATKLQLAMTQAKQDQRSLAVVYLDLDGFKAINDRYGHAVGDQLLVTLARRMKKSLRDGDTLARLGGDEFVAVLLDLANSTASDPILKRLLDAAARPIPLGDFTLQVSASLGVTFYPQTEEVDADQLLRQADQAMYQAKLAGKNCYHFFDAAHDRHVRVHHETRGRIRQALRDREFVLYYQPKVNMRTGVVIGAEALIRWQHPERGLLSPAEFLPAIEDHPLAIAVGEWVIDTALAQMERWQSAGRPLPVSVNVSARQLQQAEFTQRLRELLAAHPAVKPSDLELEILETSALEDLGQVAHLLRACGELGVTFALDDFGTGYSSLTYLKHLTVATIKIDQSFVRGILVNKDDIAILHGILGMAAAFQRTVIAEGVETVEHGELLLRLGCELAQGYGIARPMPAASLPDWAAAWRPYPAWSAAPAIAPTT